MLAARRQISEYSGLEINRRGFVRSRARTRATMALKVFEYTFLDKIFPILHKEMVIQLSPKPPMHISCQDAIFATQEATVHTLQEGRVENYFVSL